MAMDAKVYLLSTLEQRLSACGMRNWTLACPISHLAKSRLAPATGGIPDGED